MQHLKIPLNKPQLNKPKLKALIEQHLSWDDDLDYALNLALENDAKDKTLARGVEVLAYILQLSHDKETVLATLLSDRDFSQDGQKKQLEKRFGVGVAKLVNGVLKLNDISTCDHDKVNSSPEQAERLRRLLLAIIDDVRVMLIKLCYRLVRLKYLKHSSYDERMCIAKESMDIFAPLANRLGIGRLKWEIEDLAFRALNPQAYKHIAQLLEEKRIDRELFIQTFTAKLSTSIEQQNIKASVSGRVKHIVSIWRKMQRKNLEFHELFDVRAVRILVDSLADCYAVLGIVHTTWKHVPAEFDDYVANPKGNGYQSIHTAVVGGSGKIVEIQIRTHDMHEKSEFGVASHWRYKEGVKLDQSMEKSLMVLRDLLAGSAEDAKDVVGGLSTELASSRVYVFSPQGKIIDLPQGATALDFAYAIHTSVGHRCRGAKVNGKIITLTTALEMADSVEILTTKEPAPSRDWMNKNLGFLKSTSARAKVRNWFNHQNFEQNVLDGKHLLDREYTKFSLHDVDVKLLLKHFKMADETAFYADIGRGTISVVQIIGFLHHDVQKQASHNKISNPKKDNGSAKGVNIQGVGNLLTQIANCCKPVFGDQIIGYITQGAGVTIHQQECPNISALDDEKRQRLINVDWAGQTKDRYPSNLLIIAYDRSGLLKDISAVLSNEKLNVLKINSNSDQQTLLVSTHITIEVDNVSRLGLIIDKLLQVDHVQSVKRVNHTIFKNK